MVVTLVMFLQSKCIFPSVEAGCVVLLLVNKRTVLFSVFGTDRTVQFFTYSIIQYPAILLEPLFLTKPAIILTLHFVYLSIELSTCDPCNWPSVDGHSLQESQSRGAVIEAYRAKDGRSAVAG